MVPREFKIFSCTIVPSNPQKDFLKNKNKNKTLKKIFSKRKKKKKNPQKDKYNWWLVGLEISACSRSMRSIRYIAYTLQTKHAINSLTMPQSSSLLNSHRNPCECDQRESEQYRYL